MNNDNSEAKGGVERAILFLAGCIMASIGVGLLYFVYRMGNDGKDWAYVYLYMIGCTGFAFLLLRGAFFTVIPETLAESISLSNDR